MPNDENSGEKRESAPLAASLFGDDNDASDIFGTIAEPESLAPEHLGIYGDVNDIFGSSGHANPGNDDNSYFSQHNGTNDDVAGSASSSLEATDPFSGSNYDVLESDAWLGTSTNESPAQQAYSDDYDQLNQTHNSYNSQVHDSSLSYSTATYASREPAYAAQPSTPYAPSYAVTNPPAPAAAPRLDRSHGKLSYRTLSNS